MSLGVHPAVCVHCISLGGKVNVLYPVLSSLLTVVLSWWKATFIFRILNVFSLLYYFSTTVGPM